MLEPKGEIDAANERAVSRLAKTPTAIATRYDRRIGRLASDLSSGLSISFKPHDAEGLEEAEPEQLYNIEISPSGRVCTSPPLMPTFTARPFGRLPRPPSLDGGTTGQGRREGHLRSKIRCRADQR